MSETIFLLTAVPLLILWGVWWASKRRRAALLATIKVVTLPNFSSTHLQNGRHITIFLPPDYCLAANRRYPVLYLNDGQDKKALRLHGTVAKLTALRHIPPIIVVAIPTNDDRLQEYGTAVCPNAQNLGTKAGEYGRFLTEELMPAINQQFRSDTRPTQTAIFGASLGGLSAFDMAWNYPDKFGVVGVMSGSFWWRAAADETALPPNERIAHEMVRQTAVKPSLRLWFEAATLDETSDRDHNGVIDAIQDTLELIEELERIGFKQDEDVLYRQVAGGRHNYVTWAQLLPDFLRWAFATQS